MASLRQRSIPLLAGLVTIAAIPLAACSPAPRDFGSGGAASSSSSQGGSSVAVTSGAGGGGGGGGGMPTVCAPGMKPYAGPLCGPPAMPCKALADETLPDPPNSRIGPPSIALDPSCNPQILFDNNVQKFNGFYSVRVSPDKWTIESTPFEITSSGFAVLDDGTPLVVGLANQVWQKPKGGIWSSGAQFPPENISNADGFAREPSGDLHLAAYNTKTTSAAYAYLLAGTSMWSIVTLGPNVSARFPIAISPEGKPHLTYWSSAGGNGWQLVWASPPNPVEVAIPLGSSVLDINAQQQKLVVTAGDASNPDGVPHVLFARAVKGSTTLHELVVTKRLEMGKWGVLTLDAENPQGTYCTGAPAAGQKCSFDFETIGSLGAVASQGGDIRYFYWKVHHMGMSTGVCMGGLCTWSVGADIAAGEIRVAWVDANDMPMSASVVSNVNPNTARVVLDTIGHVHVAFLDAPPKQSGTSVRYLQIGP